jgi:hypothetical protein
MLLSPTTDPASTSCESSSNEALLQILFNDASSSSVSSTAVMQAGGMSVSVTIPTNGTILDSFTFRQGDILTNLTACLSRSGCYALELINFWKGYYQIFYDGAFLTDSTVEFPSYVRAAPQGSSSNLHNGSSSTNGTEASPSMSPSMSMMTPDDDNQRQQQQSNFEPYESNLTFVELVTPPQQQQQQGSSSSSCVPQCDPTTESLYEVQIYAGSYGDGALSWRIEQDGGQGDSEVGGGAAHLMGCEEDASGEAYKEGASSSTSTGRCGTVNGVRLQRACLPKRIPTGCRRFVMGHPNRVPSQGSAEVYADQQQQQQQQQQQHEYSQSQHPSSVDRWVGHYHPSFQVSVNGRVAAEGTSATFASADLVSNGNGSAGSEGCANGEALLEIFRYRTAAPLRYSLRDLHTLDIVLRSSSPSNSSNMLGYERQCVPASRCYDLTFTYEEGAASAFNSSIGGGGASTRVVLGGTYYANTVVRDYKLRIVLGERCERQEACSAEQSLVQVDIDTSLEAHNASQHVPGYYCAWSVLDERDPPNASRLPAESTTYFSNGYSGGSMFRHYACVPDLSLSLSFAMLRSVPSDVTWTLERNGAVLDCREFHENHSAPFEYLNDYILTPLDGSCRHSPTVAGRASSSPGSMSTGLIVGIAIGILVSVAFLGVAVLYSGGGEEERSRRRGSNNNNNTGAGGGGAAAAASNRSTGTVCESDVVWSDDDDEEDCGS